MTPIKRKSSLKKPLFSRLYLILSFVFILGTLSYIIFTLLPKPEPVQIAEVGSPTGTVSLALTPATINLAPGAESSLNLTYNSPTQQLTIVQIELNYNPAFIEPLAVEPSTSFPTVIQTPRFENNKISFTVGVNVSGGAGLTGTGSVATLRLKALSAGNTNLAFTDNALAATIEGGATNALKEAAPAALNITSPASPAPSPSLSPSPTPSPSPKPSPSPSPSPTPKPSPSPSPKPSPSPSPSPTPKPSPSPSPSPTPKPSPTPTPKPTATPAPLSAAPTPPPAGGAGTPKPSTTTAQKITNLFKPKSPAPTETLTPLPQPITKPETSPEIILNPIDAQDTQPKFNLFQKIWKFLKEFINAII